MQKIKKTAFCKYQKLFKITLKYKHFFKIDFSTLFSVEATADEVPCDYHSLLISLTNIQSLLKYNPFFQVKFVFNLFFRIVLVLLKQLPILFQVVVGEQNVEFPENETSILIGNLYPKTNYKVQVKYKVNCNASTLHIWCFNGLSRLLFFLQLLFLILFSSCGVGEPLPRPIKQIKDQGSNVLLS